MKLSSVESNRQHLDGGSMFGNAPRELWQRWLPADERHRVELACRCLLVEELNGKTVLFEAGIGAFLEPKLADRFGIFDQHHRLLQSLDELGFSHEDIDAVVISHLHFDHVGGLFSAWDAGQPMRLLFPNARIFVGHDAWETANTPHLRDKPSFIPEQIQLLTDSGRLEIVSSKHHPFFGEQVRFEFSDGHTKGLMLSEIGGDGGVVYAADLIPGTPWVHLPLTMGYDRFPELVIDEKLKFLEDKLQRNVRLFYTHDPDYALSSISKDDNGHYHAVEKKPAVTALEI